MKVVFDKKLHNDFSETENGFMLSTIFNMLTS